MAGKVRGFRIISIRKRNEMSCQITILNGSPRHTLHTLLTYWLDYYTFTEIFQRYRENIVEAIVERARASGWIEAVTQRVIGAAQIYCAKTRDLTYTFGIFTPNSDRRARRRGWWVS